MSESESRLDEKRHGKLVLMVKEAKVACVVVQFIIVVRVKVRLTAFEVGRGPCTKHELEEHADCKDGTKRCAAASEASSTVKAPDKKRANLLYIEDNFALTNVADKETGYNSVKPVSKSRIYHLHNLHHVVKGKE